MASSSTQATPAVGENGMVAAAHPLASEAGVNVLRSGGNAFDAAVAAAATIGAAEPMMSGMGGLGWGMFYTAASGTTRYLDFSGRLPRSLDPAPFRKESAGWEEARSRAKAVLVPGNPAGWFELHKTWGRLPWSDVIQPAIRVAEEGIEVSAFLAESIALEWRHFSDVARQTFGRNGEPLTEGARLVQSDYASTLRRLAEDGPDVLYRGELSGRIAKQVQSQGGFLTTDDLADYEATWMETVSLDYRGYRVVVPGPPCTSFDGLMKLAMMSTLDVAALGHNSVEMLHAYIEFSKLSTAERIRFGGDPAHYEVPIDRLLDSGRLREMAASIDMQQAAPYQVIPEPPDSHTTHLAVADGEGNVVSLTQTLGVRFGSKVMVEGFGLWMNNIGFFFEHDPAGLRNDVGPGKRLAAPVMPSILLRDDRPVIAIGSPGGYGIIQTVPQMIMNLVDHGLDIQSAISAPRLRLYEDGEVGLEERIDEDVCAALTERGHAITRLPAYSIQVGGAQGIVIDPESGRFEGGADPRRDGQAIGLSVQGGGA